MKTSKQIETSIVINASKNAVWSALIHLENYENWNPFIISSKGTVKVGNTLKNTLKNGEKKMEFSPKITQCIENEKFEWIGHLFIPKVFDGRHYFKLEEIDSNSTRLIHGEHFSGLLSGLILKSIKEDTIAGFKSMNVALKQQVENRA